MGLFRQINSTVRSAMFALNSVIKNKETQGRNSMKMVTSLTIFATSIIGLGSTLVNKARKKIKNSGGSNNQKNYSNNQNPKRNKDNKEKKSKNNNDKNLFNNNSVSEGKSKSQIKREELAELLTKQARENEKNLPPKETIYTPEFFAKKNEYNMPPAFYDVYIDLKTNWNDYISGASNNPNIKYTGKSFEITLYPNASKLYWEEMLHGTINGKSVLDYSPEERAKIMEKYDPSKTAEFQKQQLITISPHGLFNQDGVNYIEDCENDSEILSRMSVDYGKNYIPFFNHLLSSTNTLMRRGYL